MSQTKSSRRKKNGGKQPRKKVAASSPKVRRLGRADGCQAEIRILERSGRKADRVERVVSFPAAVALSKTTRGESGTLIRPPASLPDAATEAFAAIGHPQRAKMLLALLRGPATYRAIQKVTKLKAGPLYHHVNQLRLAGLIAPRQRDLYELTRGGRNLALLAIAAVRPLADSRRRPLG